MASRVACGRTSKWANRRHGSGCRQEEEEEEEDEEEEEKEEEEEEEEDEEEQYEDQDFTASRLAFSSSKAWCLSRSII